MGIHLLWRDRTALYRIAERTPAVLASSVTHQSHQAPTHPVTIKQFKRFDQ